MNVTHAKGSDYDIPVLSEAMSVAVRTILTLGNPGLYRPSSAVREADLPNMDALLRDLHDTLLDFRTKRGLGNAIAAPQIGVWSRVLYVYEPRREALINPVILPPAPSEDAVEILVWEACLSFPDLLVRVRRRRSCRVSYRDQAWRRRVEDLAGIPAIVLQHECDHLDGVLAVSKAVDTRPLPPMGGWLFSTRRGKPRGERG